MADTGLQALAVPTPQAPQALQQPTQQVQHIPQNFQESPKKMQKHIYSELMTGWTPINFKKV